MHIEEMTTKQIEEVLLNREDFNSKTFTEGLVDLSKVSDYNIGLELIRRSKESDDIKTIINERYSSSWVVCVGRNEPLVGSGECLAVVFKGLY